MDRQVITILLNLTLTPEQKETQINNYLRNKAGNMMRSGGSQLDV